MSSICFHDTPSVACFTRSERQTTPHLKQLYCYFGIRVPWFKTAVIAYLIGTIIVIYCDSVINKDEGIS
jgi:hypothetical protein